jgi:ATP-binding cassette subfamily C protein CydD
MEAVRPFDPRLLRQPAVRRDVALLALLGVATAISIVVAATGLAAALAALFEVQDSAVSTAGPSGVGPGLALFVVGVAGRAMCSGLCGVVAARMAATVKAELRADLLAAAGRRGPVWLAGQRAGEIATLTGRGLDALDAYFTGYLPQLVLGVTVPAAVIVTLATADLASALIILVTLPLIPIFGILIGWQTRAATEKQWRRLQLLGGHFLDMVTGLPTLKAFNRAHAQVAAVRDMADKHRVATMRTLRIAFLSALVLELVGTLSVALVAVPIGLRLLGGGLALSTALLVLLLTPEAYAPLRIAGSRFHASMEGLTALDQAFTLLTPAGAQRTQTAAPDQPAATPPPPAAASAYARRDVVCSGEQESRASGLPGGIALAGVTVRYGELTALSDVELTVRAGERIALVGPSGGGKSTLLNLLLGFVTPEAGRVLVDGEELSTLDMDAWRGRIAWVPQRAHLFAGTLAENIALGRPEATRKEIEAAARAAALPHDLATVLGERGHGMSSGERQRVALARAFLRDAPLLLLDEPTARLDARSEQAVVEATIRLAQGRTALLVAHRPALLDAATRLIRVEAGRLHEMERVA